MILQGRELARYGLLAGFHVGQGHGKTGCHVTGRKGDDKGDDGFHTNPHSASPNAPATPASRHSATIAAAVGRGLSVRWQGRLS